MSNRSAADEQVMYNSITPTTFGKRVGGEQPLSAATVRRLIRGGHIRPDLVYVANAGGKRKNYRIHPRAVDLYMRDHSLAAEGSASSTDAEPGV